MRANEFTNIEEGWKSAVAGGLIGGALATGAANYTANKTPQNPTTEPTQQTQTSKSWNLFSNPQIKTFDDGIYTGNSRGLDPEYSDDPTGNTTGSSHNMELPITITINKGTLSLDVMNQLYADGGGLPASAHHEAKAGGYLYRNIAKFNNFSKTTNGIFAKKIEKHRESNGKILVYTYTLKIDTTGKNAKFHFTQMVNGDPISTEKGYKYNTFGRYGFIKKSGKAI